MSSVSSATSSTSSTSSATSKTDRFEDMKTEDFLALLIAELQNQDPTNPMSNEEMINQISQIQEIRSNTQLTETLEAVSLGQSMATASALIGKTIVGLPEGEAEYYEGKVAYVTLQDGMLHVDDKTISLTNVAAVLSDELVADVTDGTDGASETDSTDAADSNSTDDTDQTDAA
jgi:flagellar basal-body rod modification protein FlgD